MKGNVPTGVTADVLRLLKYCSRAQLEALAKLCGRDEGFKDMALLLEARKRSQEVLEKAYEAGKVTEEEVLDGVLAPGKAYGWIDERDECTACYQRAKEGFTHLLGEDSAKAVNVALAIASQIPSANERIAELRRLWEMAKISLPEEAVTYDVASEVGIELKKKGTYEEAKVLYLATLEGRRRGHGDEHKHTLASLTNMGTLLLYTEDY